MKSIKNINLEGDPLQSLLISHLMSDDFFFVKKYPKATFSIQTAKPLKEPTFSSPNPQTPQLHLLDSPVTVSKEDKGVEVEGPWESETTQAIC